MSNRFLKVSTVNVMNEIEVGTDRFNDILRGELGGIYELVNPKGLRESICMLVYENGYRDKLPINVVGSVLYGYMEHNTPILGDIIFASCNVDERDRSFYPSGLSDEQIEYVISKVDEICMRYKVVQGK